MHNNAVPISILTNGAVTLPAVWDLPLWSWRQYRDFQNQKEQEARRG